MGRSQVWLRKHRHEKKNEGEKAALVKSTVKKTVTKGETLVCEVCGLSVEFKEVGGLSVMEEGKLVCCGKPKKLKAKKAAKH